MLNLTRVCGTMDVGRLAAAVSSPGIDPRTWFSCGIVVAIGFDSEGLFVNVTLLPTGSTYPARVATPYSGPSFGANVPLELNDEVAIAIPDGDPQHGCVVIGRFNSASDPVPQDALDNPNDIVLVIKPGQAIRMNVSAGGKAYFGSTNATDAAVLGTTYRSAEDTLITALNTFVIAISTFAGTCTTTPASTPAATLATAATALEAAITSFEAAAESYLSQKVNIG